VLRLSGRLPSFDWDAWRNLWSGGSPLMRERTMHLPTIWLQGLQVDRLWIFSRDFGAVSLSGKKRDNDAQLVVDGRAANGEVSWAGNGGGQLNLKLARLYVPAAPPSVKVAADPSALESLPGVQAEVQDFRLNERELGKLVLSAVPEGRLWRLQRLELTSPEYHAQIQGSYDLRAPGPRTALDVKLEVSDIGAYFVRMKLPPGIKKGKAKLEGKVQWAGAPFAFDLASLTGHLQLDAKQGQFARIEPGVGKLLGVLSLQALPRRLTLDFHDVFSQGFAFNQISATSDLNAGIASTKDFKMQGPSATVDLRGNVDLIKETQNLDVRVLPGLSDSLTVAGAIVNPAIGVAAYLAQKVLRDPVDKLFASEYQVTGTWVDPTVTKKTSEPSVSKSRR
jgi:uncharacterized protein YhdP